MAPKIDFRYRARIFLDRAKMELESGDNDRLKYVALELRMAMEALTYDRAKAYEKEISPEEYKTWQPRKLMQLLLEVDPHADQKSTLACGIEEEYGQPAESMFVLGTEDVLSLSDLKKHYDALGSYLHMPTLAQIEEGKSIDDEALRTRCETIITKIENVLASPVFNITLGQFTQIECVRCGKSIRRRVTHLKKDEELDFACFSCKAPYRIIITKDEEFLWHPQQVPVQCAQEGCFSKNYLWRDEISPGSVFVCAQCGSKSKIMLSIVRGG